MIKDNNLDRLIKRLKNCHRLLHDDEPISDEEIAALIEARNFLCNPAANASGDDGSEGQFEDFR